MCYVCIKQRNNCLQVYIEALDSVIAGALSEAVADRR